MTEPNAFELVYTVEVLRKFAKYIGETEQIEFYDLHLLRGAADTVEQYVDDNDITLLEIENGNKTTDIETEKEDPPATGIGFSHSDHDFTD